MNNLTVRVNQTDLSVKEYHGQRVVTLKEIDEVHQRPEGTARKRFNDNKYHFIDGVDYYSINQPSEIRTLGLHRPQGGVPESVTLLTESGYLMLVKSFTDDLAWDVQRQLVNTYFRAKQEAQSRTFSGADRERILDIKEMNARVREMNARVRMSNQLLKLTNVDTLSKEYKNILVAQASEVLTGGKLLPLPKSEQKTMSAAEVGKRVGISAQMVGILSNRHNLKTPEYGEWYRSKSQYSNKEIDTFVYYDTVIPVLQKILADKDRTA